MTPSLRLATPHDQQIIEQILRDAFSRYIVRMGRKPQPMLDDYSDPIKDNKVYVVERDGTVQGTVMLATDHEAMHLEILAVAPSAQGSGLGRMLVEFVDDSARKAGYHTVKLHTNVTMVENIAMYSRVGYVETHRIEENGFNRVYMAKNLG
ncbi:acyl-CoA N-acyltransferase [Aspergillus ellipticus CBS 707.79]|uniref:Acyl-CoA N-acyltransferase n=1 Tax=Aspergillus ellipticus CBS 707.79 TaxID=1448320 RepID=A0A319D5Q0_9EURO|nr:acyl-CoA N-acyltransferase [Aspergillus ellipticus CBS 707.79]